MNGQKEKSVHKAVRKSGGKNHEVGANITQKVDMLRDAVIKSSNTVREAGASINQNFKKNPWSFLTGIALVALSTGYLMGRSRKV